MNSDTNSGMASRMEVNSSLSYLGITVVLFALLFVASHGNELLKQSVITAGSAAAVSEPANCRADELEEEGLSEIECELMVSNIQIILASSPSWFRSFQLLLSTIAALVGVVSLVLGMSLVNHQSKLLRFAVICLAAMLLMDIAGFVAAMGIGPLLRAQYLWPLLLWIAIHLCLLIAAISLQSSNEQQSMQSNV